MNGFYPGVLALRTKSWGRKHWEVAQSLHDLAELAAKRQDTVGEERSRREALEILRAVHPPSHPDVAREAIGLGLFLCAHLQPAEGAQLLDEGLRLAATASQPLTAEADQAKAALSSRRPASVPSVHS